MTTTIQMGPPQVDVTSEIRFSFDITKVDTEQRIVEGIASSEVKDWQGDIIPFEVACAAFEVAANTMGVREMHQPKAVGVLLKWWAIAETRQIGVQVFISRSRDGEDVLTKVKERVLKGFSIGGRATDWQYDQQARMIKALALTEISLVDVPANPEALITLFKVDADQASQKPVTVPGIQADPAPINAGNPQTPQPKGTKEVDAGQPAPQPVKTAKAVQDIPGLRHIKDGESQSCANCVYSRMLGDTLYCRQFDSVVRPDWVCDDFKLAQGDHDAGQFQPIESTNSLSASGMVNTLDSMSDIDKAADEGEKAKLEAQLVARGKTVGIARKKGEPLTPPKDYPTDPGKYADPANWSWPMEPAGRAQSAVGYYNAGAGRDKYSPREWAILGRRIARMAGAALGGRYKYDAASKKIETPKQREEKKMAADILKDDLANLLSNVRSQIGDLSERLDGSSSVSTAVTQVMAALDVAVDAAGDEKQAAAAKPSLDTGKDTAQGGKPKVVGSDDSTTTNTSVDGQDSKTTAGGASSSTPGKITPVTKDVSKDGGDDRFDKLLEIVTKLAETVAKQAGQKPVVSNPSGQQPAGDVPKKTEVKISPVAKALGNGDLQAAIEAAGGDQSRLYTEMDTLIKGQLNDMGINVSRFYVANFPNPNQQG